jgi:predicted SAM-dependent methyltransferase
MSNLAESGSTLEALRDRMPRSSRGIGRIAWRSVGARVWELGMARRDRARLRELSTRRDLRINLGSNARYLEGWVNCDMARDLGGRIIRVDVRKRWPFPDDSAVAVNSEHLIEHLARDEAPLYLREAFRVLRPGGVIRTSTPDLGGIVDAFEANDPNTLRIHQSHGYSARTVGEMVNNYFYMWGHRQIYDFETLRLLLREAGFERVERATFNESRHQDLRAIDRHDPDELAPLVLIVDAVKPEGAVATA